MKTFKILLMLSIMGIVFGCSSLSTVSDYDKNVDFSRYKTYRFYEKGMDRLRLNNLDKRRLMAAVETEMNSKGFTKSEQPDFLINLVVVARQRNDFNTPFYGGWGWGRWYSPFWGGNYGYVNHYTEGTIIIDFLDPAKKILFWHGRGSGFNLDSFSKREERMQIGVGEILAQYPPGDR